MKHLINIFSNGNKIKKNYIKLYDSLSYSDKEYIDNSFDMYSDIRDKILSIINEDYRHCPICDNAMIWKDPNKTCSNECMIKSRELTSLERYGTKNPFQNEEVREKAKHTNLLKYGVEYPQQNDDIKSKQQNTMLERFGYTTTFHDKEKIKNSLNEKYGVDYPQQNKEIRKKTVETCIDKFGSESNLSNDINKNKVKTTNLIKYGVEYPQQNDTIREKSEKSLREYKKAKIKKIYNIDTSLNLKFSLSKNYSKNYIKKLIDRNLELSDIKNEFSNSQFIINARENGYLIESNKSSYEYELVEFIKELGINNIIQSSKNIIFPYELDIFIPDYKLAIEFNGNYWHSDIFKDKNYHQNKTKMCNEKGITLISIYEYLYTEKKDVYKNIIRSKLNKNKRIFARKCIIKEVDKLDEQNFLNMFHLQNFIGSSKCYGLYYDYELLTLCSFGRSRFNKKYEYELLRNCSKPNITVVGGLSKLINHYKKEIDNKDIICYSDASISFNKSCILTKPNYVWWNKSTNKVLKRYQTMKHKLENIIDYYDESLSESDNMRNNKYVKIFDSGNYISIY